MKRRYIALIIGVAILNLVLGGIQMVKSTPFTWFESEPRKATLTDQRNYLKKHETELVETVKKINPRITSVQFEWSSVEDGSIGNGTPQGGGEVVNIEGGFNHMGDSSQFFLQLAVSDKTGLPEIETAVAPNNFKIAKGKGWVDFE